MEIQKVDTKGITVVQYSNSITWIRNQNNEELIKPSKGCGDSKVI